jgi:hypothetical protein
MNHDSDEQGEWVDRATAALRTAPVPNGPSPALIDRTVHSLRGADGVRPMWIGPRLARLAAAVALIVGLGLMAALWIHGHRSPVAIDRSVDPQPVPHVEPPHVVTPEQNVPPLPPGSAHSNPTVVAIASDVSISGRVLFAGVRPAPRPIDLRACPQCVDATHGPLFDDSLVVGEDGALQNVVVSISGGLPEREQYLAPSTPVMLDQVGCMFHPHVVAAMIGQSVIVRNSDPFMHTVHSTDADESPVFNFAQPTIGERTLQPLQVVETFRVKCDLHPWMSAWIRTFNHPYFSVTTENGEFAIRNLPPGRYRLKAWHESLGIIEKDVSVPATGTAKVDFTFASH